MKIITFVGFILLFSLTHFAQNSKDVPETKAPAVLLQVEFETGKFLTLKAADIAKLPRIEVRGKDHDGKESVYSGIELREILQFAGVKLGKELRGANLAKYLVAKGADGYVAIIALPELDAAFTDKKIIIADTQDGKPLAEKNGPWQIIIPDEKRHARWVRQVVRLSIKTSQ